MDCGDFYKVDGQDLYNVDRSLSTGRLSITRPIPDPLCFSFPTPPAATPPHHHATFSKLCTLYYIFQLCTPHQIHCAPHPPHRVHFAPHSTSARAPPQCKRAPQQGVRWPPLAQHLTSASDPASPLTNPPWASTKLIFCLC